jgi:hypothetical protein
MHGATNPSGWMIVDVPFDMKIRIGNSKIHGRGVFAVERISRGDVLLRIDDTRVVDDEHPIREDLGENADHCDYLPDGTTVLMQEPERYINHSCDPNVFVYSVGKTRFVLALRGILAGEEITYDYSVNAVGGDVWTCRCGASNCRGRHRCDFFALPERTQLRYLPKLDPWFARVHEDRIRSLLNTKLSPSTFVGLSLPLIVLSLIPHIQGI